MPYSANPNDLLHHVALTKHTCEYKPGFPKLPYGRRRWQGPYRVLIHLIFTLNSQVGILLVDIINHSRSPQLPPAQQKDRVSEPVEVGYVDVMKAAVAGESSLRLSPRLTEQTNKQACPYLLGKCIFRWWQGAKVLRAFSAKEIWKRGI